MSENEQERARTAREKHDAARCFACMIAKLVNDAYAAQRRKELESIAERFDIGGES